MTCDRVPRWLGSENAGIYSCLHLPKNNNINSVGVVLCNALGHEYTHSHRSVRFLADQLANDGIPTLRFDYYSTGDSAGDLSSPLPLSTWLQNIDSAIHELKKQSGVSSITLVGLRVGATLAAVYAETHPIDFLVLWNPCVSGQRYIREMQALSIMASQHLSPNNQEKLKGIESAGFVMHAKTASEIQSINLKKLNYLKAYQQCKKILLIERDDVVVNNKFYELLKKNNIPVEQIRENGYSDMVAEPQDTVIPKNTIQQISNWLTSNHTDKKSQGPIPPTQKNLGRTVLTWDTNEITETIVLLGKKPLIGVLSEPASKSNKHLPLIILSNSGAAHHVGPNRLYVELARTLAATGFSCLRYDLSNLGDSISSSSIHHTVTDENHPYPKQAVDDTRIVLADMKNRFDFQSFILAGLCSGSHTSFHAGLVISDYDICECILVNPLTFYWTPGMSLDIPHAYATIKDAKYYQYAITDIHKWVKFIKGQAQTTLILKFILKYTVQKFSEFNHRILELLNLKSKSPLEQDIIKYKTSNKHLSFFFSTTDPGYNILLSEAKKTTFSYIRSGNISMKFIENADHTFSKKLSRADFIDKFKNHILQRYTK